MNTCHPILTLTHIHDTILNALTAQQAKRKQYSLDGWITAERKLMLDETNKWRMMLGKSPIAEAAVRRVEQWACGHSDYSSKFALYCAELVLDCGPFQSAPGCAGSEPHE